MSRLAEIIVIAHEAEQVMEHLTQPDPDREWTQRFTRVDEGAFMADGSPLHSRHPTLQSERCFMWVVEFTHSTWRGLLTHLESLPWPRPHSVQVLIRDEDDDCFGLWMLYDSRLVEITLPRTSRKPFSDAVHGVLSRTDST
ncbi:hypothetical protein [Streptomyces sp. NPDC059949]|uniref:hypothetical protein n=1 Tax=Streptomyces sp. NPDC059949 TaxID=3347013 RepID=UPI003659B471